MWDVKEKVQQLVYHVVFEYRLMYGTVQGYHFELGLPAS